MKGGKKNEDGERCAVVGEERGIRQAFQRFWDIRNGTKNEEMGGEKGEGSW